MKCRSLPIFAAACLFLVVPTAGASAMPAFAYSPTVALQVSGDSTIEPVQYRRDIRAAGPRVRAPAPGVRGGNVRRGGRGGAAAAAVIGLGVLGAIAAGSAASAAPAPEDCYIERRRLVDDYGRVVGVRRVRVCN